MSIDLELPLPAEAVPPPPPPVLTPTPARPRFAAAQASVSFILLLVAQAIAGMVVMVGAMVVAVVRGVDINSPQFTNRLMAGATVPLLLAAGGVSALVVWLIGRFWARDIVNDRSAAGVGLVPARRQQILGWLLAGAVAGATYLAVAMWLVPPGAGAKAGPLAAAAAAGGASRLVWAALALLFAPPVEEFFFRGVLLSGFTASWGPKIAAVVVTLLFLFMHIFETWSYWPATVAIVALAVAALIARRTTGSLYPAMALHFAYNAAIVVAVFT